MPTRPAAKRRIPKKDDPVSDVETSVWSETAGANTATPPNGAPENHQRNKVNDIVREMMGAIKRWFNRANFTLTSSGAEPDYALGPATAIAAYVTGHRFGFKLHASATGAVTLNVSGVAARPVYKLVGTTETPVGAGDWWQNQRVDVVYDAALNGGAGGWWWVNQQFSSDPAISSQTGDFAAGSTTSNTLYSVAPSAASADCTLPAASAVPDGFRVQVKNNTDGKGVRILRAGSDTIGWAWLNAQALSRTDYAGLFAVWGTAYGAGNGSTTFNVRDDRGRVAAGKDDMGGAANAGRLSNLGSTTLGAAGGAQAHTLTVAEMPSHTHDYNVNTLGTVQGGAASAFSAQTTGNVNATGGGAAHNNIQPTIIENRIVKT
jgi:microcystin-dependent protein